jgi:putative PIN family toxin of toxin-antitoxin system
LRVVLDTNVLISAALKPGGLEAAVVESVLAGRFEAWATPEVWAEYEEVLSRPKFAAVRDASRRILDTLAGRVRRTTADHTSTAASDEDDNRFIECAEASQARYLITGNLRHYPAAWGTTVAVNARGLFDALGLEGL